MTKPSSKTIRAFAPASVANVACGFDALGFAIAKPGDIVTARLDEQPGVHIRSIRGDDGKLPLEASRNTAGFALLEMLQELDHGGETGISLEIEKQMPLGSGLGSSAASSVAAVVAANALLDEPFSRNELLPFAVKAEAVASGTPHADNAAASLLGGFILVRSNEPLDIIPLDVPDQLHATVVHPHIEIRTEDTRIILRKQVSLAKAVNQWGNVGALVAGLMKGDYDLIGRALHDEIIEPIRSVLIPGYDRIKKSAMDAGALGCSISGSGPSIFALSQSEEKAHQIGEAMGHSVKETGLDSDCYISKINTQGA
ncbi:MAG TPA: homoserine kinase, partial [Balneolaceae bacterium]|nr:homoserine kinase [Balneolaceae bacterium]